MSKNNAQNSIQWERAFPDVSELKTLSIRKDRLGEAICNGSGSFEEQLRDLRDLISEHDRMIQKYPNPNESCSHSHWISGTRRDKRELEKMLEAMNDPFAKKAFLIRKRTRLIEIRTRLIEIAKSIGFVLLMVVIAGVITWIGLYGGYVKWGA